MCILFLVRKKKNYHINKFLTKIIQSSTPKESTTVLVSALKSIEDDNKLH